MSRLSRRILTLIATLLLATTAVYTTPLLAAAERAGAVGAPQGEAMPGVDRVHTVRTVFLPVVSNRPITAPYDMAVLMTGDWRLYEVQHSSGSQARHQTQIVDNRFFHTKGDELHAEWEELWYTDQVIYRGTDTSPGNDMYYTLRDPGMYGSAWAPRYWNVGDLFARNPLVTFYRKSDCGVVASGTQPSWLRFTAFHQQYTFPNGITLDNVVELAWLLSPNSAPIERYFYAHFFGLVGWWSSDNNQMSYISEIHPPGARPDSQREVIGCLDRTPQQLPLGPITPLREWLGNHRR